MLVRTGRGAGAVTGSFQGFYRGTLLVKKVGIAALAAVVLAFLAAGAAAALTTRTARNPVAVADRSRLRLPVAYNGQDGWGHGAVRLSTIYVGGPDTFVRVSHWTHWTAGSAFAWGTLWADNCQPNCAAGHYAKYRAEVSLSRVAGHQGVSYFSRMRLRYYHASARDYGFRWGSYRGATIPLWIGGPG
ncbi:MAG: hypothetical protein QOG05_3969 [Streptosporangiaceae bacterium]|jgi:hypothetical protein|nr:hypothetical protein [Streptosporangiaceae bacterium]